MKTAAAAGRDARPRPPYCPPTGSGQGALNEPGLELGQVEVVDPAAAVEVEEEQVVRVPRLGVERRLEQGEVRVVHPPVPVAVPEEPEEAQRRVRGQVL